MTAALDDLVAAMVVEGDRRRHDQATRVLAAMTEREQALVREVAVMAGIWGMYDAGDYTTRPPRDSDVLHRAVRECLAMPDLYPTLARIARNAERRTAHTENGATL